MKILQRSIAALIVALTSLSLFAKTQDVPSTLVWRIGEFNASSGEFRSQDIDYANPKSDPVYVVGKSTNQDWLRFQPGPANGMTGGRVHPFTIKFNLPSQPKGIFRLKIAMLYET